jgi:hypothetical protein
MRLRGISRSDYNDMLEQQAGRCAICGSGRGDSVREPLVIDHDHATGAVRGLLCAACNSGLGHFKDSPGLLEQAKAYLQKDAA